MNVRLGKHLMKKILDLPPRNHVDALMLSLPYLVPSPSSSSPFSFSISPPFCQAHEFEKYFEQVQELRHSPETSATEEPKFTKWLCSIKDAVWSQYLQKA